MVQVDGRRITWTANAAGYSVFNFGRLIGEAEQTADGAYLAIHPATGAALRCRTLAEVGDWLAIVEDAAERTARTALSLELALF